ncbi:MAG: hypothetical protein AAFY72_08715 [Cyanobacteria bacterium J06649_4]
MLEAHEWAVLMEAHSVYCQQNRDAAFDFIKQYAAKNNMRSPIEPNGHHPPMAHAYWYLISGFELFTGILEDSPNPIWHHYTSHYGLPCTNCGKPLRTQLASYCAACGQPANPNEQAC